MSKGRSLANAKAQSSKFYQKRKFGKQITWHSYDILIPEPVANRF